jgi:hypothetical protein
VAVAAAVGIGAAIAIGAARIILSFGLAGDECRGAAGDERAAGDAGHERPAVELLFLRHAFPPIDCCELLAKSLYPSQES